MTEETNNDGAPGIPPAPSNEGAAAEATGPTNQVFHRYPDLNNKAYFRLENGSLIMAPSKGDNDEIDRRAARALSIADFQEPDTFHEIVKRLQAEFMQGERPTEAD